MLRKSFFFIVFAISFFLACVFIALTLHSAITQDLPLLIVGLTAFFAMVLSGSIAYNFLEVQNMKIRVQEKEITCDQLCDLNGGSKTRVRVACCCRLSFSLLLGCVATSDEKCHSHSWQHNVSNIPLCSVGFSSRAVRIDWACPACEEQRVTLSFGNVAGE